MKYKHITIDKFTELLFDGMRLMFGGFLGVGSPNRLIDAIIAAKVKDLTIIGNDTGFIDRGIGRLIANDQVKTVITSHIGTNPKTGEKMFSKELTVELVPQGTLIERIRCGGAGLGGILTPTGLGTVVELGKQKINVQGKDYLLETPLRADLAIIQAHSADPLGNLVYALTARNFNPLIALAADTVVAEIEHIVPVGHLEPDRIITPSILVDYLLYPKDPKS